MCSQQVHMPERSRCVQVSMCQQQKPTGRKEVLYTKSVKWGLLELTVKLVVVKAGWKLMLSGSVMLSRMVTLSVE